MGSRRTAPCRRSAPNFGRAWRGLQAAREEAYREADRTPVCTSCRRFIATSCWGFRPTLLRTVPKRAGPRRALCADRAGPGICGSIMARDAGPEDRDRRRAVDGSGLGLALSLASGHAGKTNKQRHARRRHGSPASPTRRRSPSSARAPRASCRSRTRSRQGDPRLLDRHAHLAEGAGAAAAAAALSENGRLPVKRVGLDPDWRQYRFRSVPAMGRNGCHGTPGQRAPA